MRPTHFKRVTASTCGSALTTDFDPAGFAILSSHDVGTRPNATTRAPMPIRSVEYTG